MAYARPVLCRLCRFPAPDGGVPVSEFDREKLSEWCLRMMDTELDEEGLEEAVICHFCLADARFEHQILVNTGEMVDNSGWWRTAKMSFVAKNYFEDEVVQPCFVKINCLSEKQIMKLSTRSSTDNNPNIRTEKKIVYKCPHCPEEFFRKTILRIHASQVHKGELVFSCKFCNYFFKEKQEHQEHVEKVHANNSKCFYCKKTFPAKSMAKHIRKYHRLEAIRCAHHTCPNYFSSQEEKDEHFEQVHRNEREYVECIYCKKVVAKYGSLKKHMMNYHKTEAIKCNFSKVCPTYFLTDEDRQQHIRDVHEAKYMTIAPCIYCHKKYPNYFSLSVHVNNAHSDVMIKCKWRGCHQFFHSDLDREEHFQKKHASSDQERAYQCSKCSFKTCQRSALKQHYTTQHVVEHLQCSQCPNVFKSQTSLAWHMRHVHLPKPKCSFCLETVNKLNIHLRKKRCLSCGFVANCSSQSLQHKKVCDKEHKCHYCEATFKLKKLLTAHLKRHVKISSKNDKRCHLCQRNFSTREMLERHFNSSAHLKNIQNGPFACYFCHKQFPSLSRIHAHITYIHLVTARFPCTYCEKTFSGKSSLKKHIFNNHAFTKFVKCV